MINPNDHTKKEPRDLLIIIATLPLSILDTLYLAGKVKYKESRILSCLQVKTTEEKSILLVSSPVELLLL